MMVKPQISKKSQRFLLPKSESPICGQPGDLGRRGFTNCLGDKMIQKYVKLL